MKTLRHDLIIREELPADKTAVQSLLIAAFGERAEAELVDQLRHDDAVAAALVAVADETVVGHILFSPLRVVPAHLAIHAVALAPLAVLPERQSQGTGSALVRHGIERCERAGVEAIFVVGDPRYYGRFGFSSELASKVRAPYSGPAFMALELRVGVLQPGGIEIHYADAFSRLP